MKKSVLFLFLAGTVISAKAQEVTSVMFARPMSSAHGVQLSSAQMDRMHQHYLAKHQPGGAAKSTSGTYSEWFDLWSQNFTSGTSVGYYFATYQDSNLVDNSGTSPYNMYTHGMGMSFDPLDSAYFSVAVNGGALVTPVPYPIIPGNSYTVDSFFTPVNYVRNNPSTTVVDSLVIEIVLTQTAAVTGPSTDSGAYSFKIGTADPAFLPVCYDETPRWGTIHYNGGYGNVFGAPYNAAPYINDCYFDSVFTKKFRYVVAMTDANKNDTDAFGNWNVCQTCTPHMSELPLTAVTGSPTFTISGNPRQHMVTFVSFKSGVNYPLGTSSNVANWIKLFAGEPTGSTTWFMQSSANSTIGYPGSYQEGLIAQNQIRYNDTGFIASSSIHHNTLIPAFAFADPPGFDVTQQAFHINYTGIIEGVTNVNNTVLKANAYPSPANTELNVTFSNAGNGNTVVTLTNVVGQVVASQSSTADHVVFSTATLTNGVYIYAVEANGQRTTGRIVIAH